MGVELGDLPLGRLERLSNKAGLVEHYDAVTAFYFVRVQNSLLPVERHQIKRYLYSERDQEEETTHGAEESDDAEPDEEIPDAKQEEEWEPPIWDPFNGVPDGSLEFHVLLRWFVEMREIASRR